MKYFTLLAFLFYAEIVFGQAGKLDSSFGNDGKQTIDFNHGSDFCQTLLIRPDGKILLVGNSVTDTCTSLVAAQFSQEGILDSLFGNNGNVTINVGACQVACNAAALQPDGKFLIAGFQQDYPGTHAILVRCDPDGSLDTTFGVKGIASTDFIGNAECVTFSNDKIYMGGTQYLNPVTFALMRYNFNGFPDSTFGINGEVATSFGPSQNSSFGSSLAIQEDGKILLGGLVYNFLNADFAVVRYNVDGTLDTSFNHNGKCIIDIVDDDNCKSIAIQSDGRIVMLGTSSNSFHYNFELARINPNGSIDSSFNGNGKVFTPIDFQDDEAWAVALQKDNKTLACGFSQSLQTQLQKLILVRYNNDGILDSSFAENGIIDTIFNSLEEGAFSIGVQKDGKILTAGWSANTTNSYDFAVERFISGLTVGVINFSVPHNSFFIYPNPIHSTETLQYSLVQDENISINLYDISGRLVQSFFSNQKSMQGDHKEELNFNPSLQAGNYLLVISNGKNKVSINVVKE